MSFQNNKKSCEQNMNSVSNNERFFNYKLEDYIFDVENLGLKKTWDNICSFVLLNHDCIPEFLQIKNFGELYEIGLATQDKIAKKKSGQYYTPDDVALVMSNWLLNCEGKNVCDVACGTGKLILTYLDLIGFEKSRELISNGNLYLYDFDGVALKICKTAISIKYGLDICDKIHDIEGDFLDKKLSLPPDSKVISNPPYAKISEIPSTWKLTDVLADTNEFYSSFMEKIFLQARSTVIITPFSFISGKKFFSLRKLMSKTGNGFIVAFDNVPGNIFCGRKHGIFNTNTANSVRAAITVLKKETTQRGFKVSHLLRFKNEERSELLKCDVLEETLGDEFQIVDDSNVVFSKVQKSLEPLYKAWKDKSLSVVSDYLSKKQTEYFIDVPNTCRYYTVASDRKLSRTGSLQLNLISEDAFNFLYCLINSSFAYWWWRIFDGGITYPVGLLYEMPFPINLLSEDDFEFFKKVKNEMTLNESKYIISKINAGVAQENIKFPEIYRNKINERIVKILGFEYKQDMFSKVHSNRFFGDLDEE